MEILMKTDWHALSKLKQKESINSNKHINTRRSCHSLGSRNTITAKLFKSKEYGDVLKHRQLIRIHLFVFCSFVFKWQAQQKSQLHKLICIIYSYMDWTRVFHYSSPTLGHILPPRQSSAQAAFLNRCWTSQKEYMNRALSIVYFVIF